MKNISSFFLTFVLANTIAMASHATTMGNDPKDQSSHLPNCKPNKSTQVGITFEERAAYVDSYLFLNQLINDKFFYELRAYYIHNLIVTSPPSTAKPLPSVTDEKNVDGTGAAAILGYNFRINPKVTLMPFIRLQALSNTVSAYRDSFGNKINSYNYTGYLGLKLNMDINDVFGMYAQYYGGYQRSILVGEGFFEKAHSPRINAYVSNLEFWFPYKINSSWIFIPSLQFFIAANNPNHAALSRPINNNGLTTSGPIYVIRLAYKF